MKPPDGDSAEAQRLREDRESLRAERDFYQDELSRLRATFTTQLENRLRGTRSDVQAEVEKQVGNLATRWKWLAGLLIAAAGFGGYLSIPDWIDSKVNKSVDAKVTKQVEEALAKRDATLEKEMIRLSARLEATLRTTEADVTRLRNEVNDAAAAFRKESINAVTAFQKRAEDALKDVDQHAIKTKEEITQRGLIVVSGVTGPTHAVGVHTMNQTVSEGKAWFGEVPSNVVAIGGSSLKQHGYEKGGTPPMGAFSESFQSALRNPRSDQNGDGSISWREALDKASTQLQQSEFKQTPVIAGDQADRALFRASKVEGSASRSGKLFAVLVGCSTYKSGGTWELPGAINDARQFQKLLREADENGRLSRELGDIQMLLNTNATSVAIEESMRSLIQLGKKGDSVVFFFSGHTSHVPATFTKQLVPYDFGEGQEFDNLRADRIANAFSKCAAAVTIIIDG